jgi:type I restriction enzyme, S subunit
MMTADKMQQIFSQDGEIVPRLRFPEFCDAGEWEEKRLGDLGTLVSGLTYNPADVRESGILVLRSSNIQNDEISLDDCVYVRRGVNGANLTQPDDILICIRNGSKSLIGKNAIVPKGMPICTHGAFMTVFRAAASHFVRVLLQTTAYKKQVAADLGATINSINGSQLLKYCFTVPKPAEQQKIADCLGSLDDLIAAEGWRLEALRQHKQGLMQQLFPQPGETAPRLRFPEFANTAWESKTLGTLVSDTERPIVMDDEKEYRLVTVKRRYGGVVTRKVLKGKAISVKSQFLIEANDFLVSKRQIVHDACGLVPAELVGSIVSNEYSVLTAKNGCYIEFFNYFTQQPRVSESFLQSSVGIVIEKMLFKLDWWLKLAFPFPSFAEQQRIADCLSSLDAQLAAQAQKLSVLKTHKQGLLQQLFPALEGQWL